MMRGVVDRSRVGLPVLLLLLLSIHAGGRNLGKRGGERKGDGGDVSRSKSEGELQYLPNPSGVYAGAEPISARDRVPAGFEGVAPGAFKCRQTQSGKLFTFPHEFVHLPARANCNLLLMGKSVTERQWSDITQQAYKLQNEIEHDMTLAHDGEKHKVNHKMLALGFLWQKYLAPRARYLQQHKPTEWTNVKASLEAVGCPLFTDNGLPDAMHAAWWADIGFTANMMWKRTTKSGLHADLKVVHDIGRQTMFEVSEGVLSWDSFRWYKGRTSCTPIVRRSMSNPSAVLPVSAREVRSAITALWAAWCGASSQQNLGACAGDFRESPNPADWAKAHPGFAYNPIGGGVSLGAKSEIEARRLEGFGREAIARFAVSRGVSKYKKDAGKYEVQRCAWNVQHEDRQTPQEELDPPEIIPRDICFREDDGGASGSRLRAYAPFARRKTFDEEQQALVLKRHASVNELDAMAEVLANKKGTKGAKGDALLRFRRGGSSSSLPAAIVSGTASIPASKRRGMMMMMRRRRSLLSKSQDTYGPLNSFSTTKKKKNIKKVEHEHSLWFLSNTFDSETHYGVVSNPKRSLSSMAEGANVVNTEVELMSVAGMVPFGWNRSNCMLCWSAPIWIVNLVRLCGGQGADKVGFYQAETEVQAWSEIDRPVVYGCGNVPFDDLTRGEAGDQQRTFLRAKLFEGLAEEKNELPGWGADGAIEGCSSSEDRAVQLQL